MFLECKKGPALLFQKSRAVIELFGDLLARVAAGGFADLTGGFTGRSPGGTGGFTHLVRAFLHRFTGLTGGFAHLTSRFAHGRTGFSAGFLHGFARRSLGFGRGFTGRFLDFAAANEGESAQNEAAKGH